MWYTSTGYQFFFESNICSSPVSFHLEKVTKQQLIFVNFFHNHPPTPSYNYIKGLSLNKAKQFLQLSITFCCLGNHMDTDPTQTKHQAKKVNHCHFIASKFRSKR